MDPPAAAPLVGLGVAVAVKTPVNAVDVALLLLLPTPIELELVDELLTGVPGLPAATLLLGALYCLEFEYHTPAPTIPFPAAMSSIWSLVQVSLTLRSQQVVVGDFDAAELVCVAFIGPDDEKFEALIGSPVLRSVPSMMRVKTVNAVSG